MKVANNGGGVLSGLLRKIRTQCKYSILYKSSIKAKKNNSAVTRFIKCVAFCEMRNCAALMASRTAKILFYGEETTGFV